MGRSNNDIADESSIQRTDRESASVAKVPDGRVKLADIEAAILCEITSCADALVGSYWHEMNEDGLIKRDKAVSEYDVRGRLNIVTLHVIVMKNGFTVIGKSAPLEPANFNAQLGAKFAREDAIRQLWPLMAFSRLDKQKQ